MKHGVFDPTEYFPEYAEAAGRVFQSASGANLSDVRFDRCSSLPVSTFLRSPSRSGHSRRAGAGLFSDPFTLDEVNAIAAHLHAKQHKQIANYINEAFFARMRPSEQIVARWSDFGSERGELRVHPLETLQSRPAKNRGGSAA
jgi:hypothetical protein